MTGGADIIAKTGDGVFLSTNSGAHWVEIDSDLVRNNDYIRSIAVPRNDTGGLILFAGTSLHGVFRSTNDGVSWDQVNLGLLNTDAYVLAVSSGILYAGTWGGGGWKCPLSEMITAVKNEHFETPSHFDLEQNYPNPFNASTITDYRTPKDGFITLKIYNILGQTIRTLVDEREAAGTHYVIFNAGDLASAFTSTGFNRRPFLRRRR